MTVPRKPFNPVREATAATDRHAMFTHTWPPGIAGRALCADVDDPEMFFPKRGGRSTADAAKEVCKLCDVRAACLDWALSFSYEQDQDGIYGGTTSSQRRQLRRQRNKEIA